MIKQLKTRQGAGINIVRGCYSLRKLKYKVENPEMSASAVHVGEMEKKIAVVMKINNVANLLYEIMQIKKILTYTKFNSTTQAHSFIKRV